MALSPRAEGEALRRPQPCSLVPTAAFLKHNLLLGTHTVQKQASSQIHKCRISKVLLSAFSPLEGRGLRTWGSDVFFETPPQGNEKSVGSFPLCLQGPFYVFRQRASWNQT